MKLAVRMMPLMVAVALAGCVLHSESHWIGSSVMNVHWEQYAFVDPVCRKMHPIGPIDSDPPAIYYWMQQSYGPRLLYLH